MRMLDAVKSVYSKYASFDGRARRSEFWMFQLFIILVDAALGGIMVIILTNANELESGGWVVFMLLPGVFNLFNLLPSFAVAFRRLHDTGRSGAWILIQLLPAVGSLILLILYCEDGNYGMNSYGPDPKGRSGGIPTATCILYEPAKPRTGAGWVCSNCGRRNATDAVFCENCRKRKPVPRLCSNCGSELTKDARFCRICGAPTNPDSGGRGIYSPERTVKPIDPPAGTESHVGLKRPPKDELL